MSMRFRRSIRIGKLLQMNLSKSGVGFSAGVEGLRLRTGPRGTYFTFGMPGTGLYWEKKLNNNSFGDFTPDDKDEKKKRSSRSKKRGDDSTFDPSEPLKAPRGAPTAEVALVQGLNEAREGDIDKAIRHLKDASKADPGAAMLAAYFTVRHRRGEIDDAIQMLEKLVASDDEIASPMIEKYMPGASVEMYITPNVQADVPVNGMGAAILLAELYQMRGREAEATGLMESLFALTEHPVVRLSLCDLYAGQGLWDGVVKYGSGVESDDDVTLGTMILYGMALQQHDLHTAAIKVLTDALRRKKDRSKHLLAEARYWRARSYEASGKASRARDEYELVFAEDPAMRDVKDRLRALSAQG